MSTSTLPDPGFPRNSAAAIWPTTLATPTYGPGGSFTVGCSIHIAAPPAVCAEVVLRHASYPSWNRFCRSVTVPATPAAAAAAATDSDPGPDAPAFARGGADFLAVGGQFTFDVHMDAANPDSSGFPIALAVTHVEPIGGEGDARRGWRVAWQGTGTPGFVLRSERVHEFVEAGPGETDYSCWETFYGLVAPVVRLAVGGKLVPAFGVWMEDLKGEAEKKVKGAA